MNRYIHYQSFKVHARIQKILSVGVLFFPLISTDSQRVIRTYIKKQLDLGVQLLQLDLEVQLLLKGRERGQKYFKETYSNLLFSRWGARGLWSVTMSLYDHTHLCVLYSDIFKYL